MANLKVKFQVAAISSIKSEQASLFTVITSLKYKFVLHLLKEDGLSVSVFNFYTAKLLFRRNNKV